MLSLFSFTNRNPNLDKRDIIQNAGSHDKRIARELPLSSEWGDWGTKSPSLHPISPAVWLPFVSFDRDHATDSRLRSSPLRIDPE